MKHSRDFVSQLCLVSVRNQIKYLFEFVVLSSCCCSNMQSTFTSQASVSTAVWPVALGSVRTDSDIRAFFCNCMDFNPFLLRNLKVAG